MNCMSIRSNSLDFRINQLIEDVFKFTLRNNFDSVDGLKAQPLVYLEETAAASDKSFMDIDVLEHALFERLLLDNPASCIVRPKESAINIDLKATLNECLTYLFECYKDLSQYRSHTVNENKEWIEIIDNMTKLVIRNAATALKQPDLYSSQDIHAQVKFIFLIRLSRYVVSSYS